MFTRSLRISGREETRRGLQNVLSGNCCVSRCACPKVQLLPPLPPTTLRPVCFAVIAVRSFKSTHGRQNKEEGIRPFLSSLCKLLLSLPLLLICCSEVVKRSRCLQMYQVGLMQLHGTHRQVSKLAVRQCSSRLNCLCICEDAVSPGQ